MDELNLSLTPSSLHAPSFLFDSPNAVVNAPSFLLPTEYSPYRESVVLPEMPHAIRIRLQTDIAEGLLSSEIGTTADESNRIAVNGKYSLPGSSFIAMSPMISSGNAPVAVFHPYPVKPLLLQGSLLPISPLMPHLILSRLATHTEIGMDSSITGAT